MLRIVNWLVAGGCTCSGVFFLCTGNYDAATFAFVALMQTAYLLKEE